MRLLDEPIPAPHSNQDGGTVSVSVSKSCDNDGSSSGGSGGSSSSSSDSSDGSSSDGSSSGSSDRDVGTTGTAAAAPQAAVFAAADHCDARNMAATGRIPHPPPRGLQSGVLAVDVARYRGQRVRAELEAVLAGDHDLKYGDQVRFWNQNVNSNSSIRAS